MELQLIRLNPWWEKKYSIKAIERPDYFKKIKEKEDLITFLIGLRRIGKTTLMRLYIEKLQNKINPKHILYVALDHPAFIKKTIFEIIETFRKINKIKFDTRIHVFLDEIQSKENFETELKALIDNENIRLICSGSQSILLKNKGAKLTGRMNLIEIKPLNFQEYLKFRNIKIEKKDTHLLKSYFEEYMEFGGIPKYVIDKDPEYIIQLVDNIITKDIISYHNIKNTKIIKELFLLLCERSGKKLSINKIAKILSTNIESIRQYISYLEETFLIHLIYRKTKTLNEKIKSNKKVYISDVGIKNIMVGFKDKGAVFENLVFLKIKDKKPEYYFENNKEIDFVWDKQGIECKYKENLENLDYLKKNKIKVKIISDYEFFL